MSRVNPLALIGQKSTPRTMTDVYDPASGTQRITAGGDGPPPGYRPKVRRRLDLDLSVASPSGGYLISTKGSAIWVNDAAGSNPVIQAIWGSDTVANAVVFRRDYFYRGEPWTELRLVWDAQTGCTMTLQLIDDFPDDTVGIL